MMDQEACVEKACQLITEAGEQEAKLLVFPEAFISGYPRGLVFASAVGSRGEAGRTDFARYWRSALSVPSEGTERIAQIVRKYGMYVVLGIIEKADAGNHGTLFCTMLYFDAHGQIIGKHRKIKPTGIERLVWGEGDGSTLAPVETPFGCMGGLVCWENYMPQARMYLYSKGIHLYIAPTADARGTWQGLLQTIACEGRCFVLSANQYVTKAMYPEDLACYGELASEPEVMCRGGSAILDPFGEYLAKPVYDQEAMLYAELDLNQINQSHLDFDVVGHYARPDLFRLVVNECIQKPVDYSPFTINPDNMASGMASSHD